MKALVAAALSLVTAWFGAGPYLDWRARSRQAKFCALVLAGKIGESSQLMPEDSRTAYIRDAKELPSSCAVQGGDAVLLGYPGGREKRLVFAYAPVLSWKRARLVSVVTP